MSVFSLAQSQEALQASDTLQALQQYFVSALENHVSDTFSTHLEAVDWGRDGGQHGGGMRYGTRDTVLFNRGVSQFFSGALRRYARKSPQFSHRSVYHCAPSPAASAFIAHAY